MTEIRVPISPGELLDKITILEIKSARIEDREKRDHVRYELDLLSAIWTDSGLEDDRVSELRSELGRLNDDLWRIEDEIRLEEERGEFGERFIELARAVYTTNDRRARIKRKINVYLGSSLVEEKSH